nr:Slp family lipoprotein [Thiocapsa imhoffii]
MTRPPQVGALPSPRPPRRGHHGPRHAPPRVTAHLPILLFALTLGACAHTRVPEAVRDPKLPSPAIAAVQQDPAAFVGQSVRWGGTILAVHNEPNQTQIEILARPLHRDGRPHDTDRILGRFLVIFAGFKDPATFPTHHRLTVVGPLQGIAIRDVGEFPYHYPLVEAQAWFLWPPPIPRNALPPVYADPWFNPWPWAGPWPGPRMGVRYGLWY